MRERGLKLFGLRNPIGFGKSLPMRERGLKQAHSHIRSGKIHVAPHAGAWIETRVLLYKLLLHFVAPHAGAWIETTMAANIF